MILHPVAVASDVDDMAVVHKAVDESRRHHLVAEHAAPVLETLVRRQHSRRLLVPGATGLALLTESIFTPPYWLHLVIWPPLILGGVVALLRPFKATLIALQFKYKAREGGRSSLD